MIQAGTVHHNHQIHLNLEILCAVMNWLAIQVQLDRHQTTVEEIQLCGKWKTVYFMGWIHFSLLITLVHLNLGLIDLYLDCTGERSMNILRNHYLDCVLRLVCYLCKMNKIMNLLILDKNNLNWLSFLIDYIIMINIMNTNNGLGWYTKKYFFFFRKSKLVNFQNQKFITWSWAGNLLEPGFDFNHWLKYDSNYYTCLSISIK